MTRASTHGSGSIVESEVGVTLARGDGIGPEVTDAVVAVLEAAGARVRWDEVEIGERLYLSGHSSGIRPESWDVIRTNPVMLKAPITTPLGGGYKSLNVTLRKALNLYANVRATSSYAPFVPCRFPKMDLIIVRENEEDLYAGIEHQQTPEVTQVLKLVTRPGCERIVRYAFALARAHGRRRVTCMTKSNIMKQTDGLFARVFEEVASEYPDLDHDHQIIDIGAARLAASPEVFDVIVTLNLYGDILSDIAAQVGGSVGLAGSANIGDQVSMFEAVHGSAPDIAGRDLANPSGLLRAAVDLLIHVGQADVASRVHNAWLRTLEDGVTTADMDGPHAKRRVGTSGFARAVIGNLGEEPATLPRARFATAPLSVPRPSARPRPAKTLEGVDVFLDWEDRDPARLGEALARATPPSWRLKMITNRGVKVWPEGLPETFCTDHWRCRFLAESPSAESIVGLLGALGVQGFDVIKTENLYAFDGVRGYSLGQGE